LAQKQSNFAASARTIQGAEVRQHFDVVFGGVSMLVPETEIDTLRTLPGVKAVYLDQLLHLDTNVSPQFIGAPKIWSKLGGQEKAGEGVIVGSLDSGVWPEHPPIPIRIRPATAMRRRPRPGTAPPATSATPPTTRTTMPSAAITS
ncbi:MAG TPA: protease inhibitor I9 family protein, partial [Methylomirabilota bacterium]|nr:protease inhibitor I9 family protein [Methylomirabilota bacterium]